MQELQKRGDPGTTLCILRLVFGKRAKGLLVGHLLRGCVRKEMQDAGIEPKTCSIGKFGQHQDSYKVQQLGCYP